MADNFGLNSIEEHLKVILPVCLYISAKPKAFISIPSFNSTPQNLYTEDQITQLRTLPSFLSFKEKYTWPDEAFFNSETSPATFVLQEERSVFNISKYAETEKVLFSNVCLKYDLSSFMFHFCHNCIFPIIAIITIRAGFRNFRTI